MIFETLGNVELLSQARLAIFASRQSSVSVSEEALKLVDRLLTLPIALAGGWQAPLERQIFRQLATASNSINCIYYLAKNINIFKPDKLQQHLLDSNRLLIIAPQTRASRPAKPFIKQRDNLLFEQNKRICFLSIRAGGRLAGYVEWLSAHKYSLFLLDHPDNSAFDGPDLVKICAANAEQLLS